MRDVFFYFVYLFIYFFGIFLLTVGRWAYDTQADSQFVQSPLFK